MIKKIFSSLKLNKTTWLLVVVISLAFTVRLFKLGQIPSGLYWDEVAMLADAKVLSKTGRDLHQNSWLQPLFISYGDYKLPVYLWLAAVSVNVLGATNLALRLVSALAGIGTIIISVLIVRRLFSQIKQQRLLALGVIAALGLSPWAIMFSRTGFEGHLGQMFLALAVLFALKAKQKWWWLLVATFWASLATYTYFSVRFVWPIILFGILVFELLQPESKLRLLPKNTPIWFNISLSTVLLLGLSFGLFAISLLPMINSPNYQASNQFRFSTISILNMKDWAVIQNQLRAQAGNTILARVFYHRQWLMLREFFKNISDNLSLNFLFLNGDPNLRHGTGLHGLFLLPFLGFFAIGFYQLARHYWRQLMLILIWWLAALVPASVPEETPHALRSLNALVPLSLIIGFGIYWVLQWLLVKQDYLSKVKLVIASGLVTASLVCFGGFTYHYFNVYPTQSNHDWQTGFKPTAKKICQLSDQANQVWVAMGDDRFFLWPLAYCDYSTETINNLKFDQNYHLTQLDNIFFDSFNLNKFNASSDKILLVTDRTQLRQQVKIEPTKQVSLPNNNQAYFIWNHRP